MTAEESQEWHGGKTRVFVHTEIPVNSYHQCSGKEHAFPPIRELFGTHVLLFKMGPLTEISCAEAVSS